MENRFWYMHFFGEQLFLASYPLVEGRDHPSLECRDYIKFLGEDFEICRQARHYAMEIMKNNRWKSQKDRLEEVGNELLDLGLLVEFVKRKANRPRKVREGVHYYGEIFVREVIPREDAASLNDIGKISELVYVDGRRNFYRDGRRNFKSGMRRDFVR